MLSINKSERFKLAVIKSLSLSLFFLLSSQLLSSNLQAENSDTQKPSRIVSLSLCTDQVLLMLVEDDRIQALSHLSNDPVYSFMHERGINNTPHHGLAEEIIPLKPDLILGSKYTTGNTVQMLKTLGYDSHLFPSPTTIEEIEAFVRDIATLVKEKSRGEELIKAMHQDITDAQRLTQDMPIELAISYGPNGFTAGTYTLKNTVLKMAGYRNLSGEIGIDYYGNISVEKLLVESPDAIIIDEAIPDQNSLAQAYVNHPALQKIYHGSKRPSVLTNYWLCPGPTAGKAILSLAKQRAGLKSHFSDGVILDQTQAN